MVYEFSYFRSPHTITSLKYLLYIMTPSDIIATWNLDGWAIGKETFRTITEILPAGSTILEFGSGMGTDKLSNFYNMKSAKQICIDLFSCPPSTEYK